jgi:hypothetical protein
VLIKTNKTFDPALMPINMKKHVGKNDIKNKIYHDKLYNCKIG